MWAGGRAGGQTGRMGRRGEKRARKEERERQGWLLLGEESAGQRSDSGPGAKMKGALLPTTAETGTTGGQLRISRTSSPMGNRGKKKADRKPETPCRIKGGYADLNELPATRPPFTRGQAQSYPGSSAQPHSVYSKKSLRVLTSNVRI